MQERPGLGNSALKREHQRWLEYVRSHSHSPKVSMTRHWQTCQISSSPIEFKVQEGTRSRTAGLLFPHFDSRRLRGWNSRWLPRCKRMQKDSDRRPRTGAFDPTPTVPIASIASIAANSRGSRHILPRPWNVQLALGVLERRKDPEWSAFLGGCRVCRVPLLWSWP